ncbi:MAG TPA: hypothetical protein VJA94_25060 [Candidatus Angelobacter sp.]
MTQENHEEEIKALLRESFPPPDRELRRDLWPDMLQRLNTSAVRIPWYDWALIAGLAAVVIILPKLGLLFGYNL